MEDKILSLDLKHNKNVEYRTLAKKCIDSPSVSNSGTYASYTSPTGYYGGNSQSTINHINCTFYEWSRIDGTTRKFNDEESLYKFLSESKIDVTNEDRYSIRSKYMLFITCIPGENRLLISSSYYGLQNMLENCYKEKKLSVPKTFYSTL